MFHNVKLIIIPLFIMKSAIKDIRPKNFNLIDHGEGTIQLELNRPESMNSFNKEYV